MENIYHLLRKADEDDRTRFLIAAFAVSFLFLLLTLYFAIVVKLLHDWVVLPDFSHGFFVLLFCGYLVWKRRNVLGSLPLHPSWAGLPIVACGLTLLILGVLGAELYLARVSFLVVLTGCVWLLAGAEMLRVLRVPIALLLLAIPLPQVVFYQMTAPLQRLAATIATLVLPWWGVPVLQQGNIIHLPRVALEVAEACSGIRSLFSLCTLCVMYSYFAENRWQRRVLLVLCSIPIAVAANAFRIIGTGVLVQYRGVEMAMGFFHEFSGLLMFAVSVVMLMGIHVLLRRWPVKE